jgi:hypothetical protein
MSQFDPIQASTAPSKPAESEKSYPYWQAVQILIQAPQPGGPLMADVRFRAYRVLDDGSVEMAPDDSDQGDDLGNSGFQRRLRGDVRKLAATYPEVATAVQSLLTAMETAGQGEGVL